MINFLRLLNRSSLQSRGLRAMLYMALLMIMTFAGQVRAAHIMGGEMTYRYIGVTSGNALQYSVTVNIYADRSQGGWNLTNPNDPASGGQDVRINLAAYSADDNTRLYNSTFLSPGLNQPVSQRAPIFFAKPELPAACGAITCLDNYIITRSSLTVILTLPFTFNGYNVIYQDVARNNAITNISNPGSRGLSLYTGIPGPNYQNSSPQFTDNAVPVLFTNDTTFFVNTAFDPDGDRLVYSFTSALNGGGNNPPTWTVPANIPYAPNYTFGDPLGPNGTSTIDPSTGITKHFCTQTGQYVVAVAIQEWRRLPNGTEIQIGTTRRELQLLVARQGNLPGDCPPNSGPQQIGSFPTNITIQQGQSTTFNVEYRDPEANNVTLTGTSIILQGGQGYTGPLAAFNPLQGSTARGTFTWNTNCNVPPNTYSVVIKAEDAGCPPKSISQVVNITVTKATGPSVINGQNNPCVSGAIPYWVNQNLNGFTRQWKVQGGTIVRTSANSDSVRVNWTSTTGFVRVISTTPAGCRDSVTLNVNPVTVTPVNAGNNVTICQGSNTTLTATGGNNTFTWRTLSGTLVGNTASVSVSPTTTTQYVVSSTSGACAVTDTVQVSVVANPLSPVAAASVCASFNGPVYNNNAIAGYTYQWTVAGNNPAVIFLDPTNVRNPRVIINTVGTYRLRVTATASPSGCLFRDSVSIEVRQGPTAPTQLTYTACSGQNLVLNPGGASTGFTYAWGSTQGFVSGNASSPSPTVNLTNTGTQPLVVRYPLSSTSSGCTRVDTLFVTVQPTASGAFTAQACFNTGISIGPDTPIGVTYSWSPATFLSATNVAQPTFRRTGGSATNQTTVYTLTVTSATGCITTQTWTVTALATPIIATPNTSLSVCSGISTRIGATQADTARQLASWLPTTGLNSANVFRPTFRLANTGSTAQNLVYVRTIRNTLTNCTASDTVRITLQPAVVASAGANVTTCSNQPVTIGAAASTGFTYSWSPTTGLSSASAANPTVTLTNTGVQPLVNTYVLTTTNTATGCTGTDTVQVTVTSGSAGSFTAQTCFNTNLTIGPAATTGSTYSWSPATFLSASNVAQPTFRRTGGSATNQNTVYTLTETSASGCVTTQTWTVTAQATPIIATPNSTVAVCSGINARIGAAQADTLGQVASWLPTTGLNSANVFRPTFRLANTGSTAQNLVYVRTIRNTTTNCTASDTVRITLQPAVVAVAGNDVTICSNGFDQLGAPASLGFTYSWSPTTGLSSATAANPTVTLSNAGTTQLRATYILTTTNTTTNCVGTDTVVVTVNPRAVGTNTRDSICSGAVKVFGTAQQTNTTYAWSPAALFVDATVAQAQLVNPVNTGSTPIIVNALRVSTNTTNGCVTTDTLTISINPLPTVAAGPDVELCSETSTTVGEVAQPGFTYVWGIFGNTSTTFVQGATPGQSQTLITATNTGTINETVQLYLTKTNIRTGCAKTDTVNVVVKPLPIAIAAATDTVAICTNGFAQLGAASVPNLTYQWTPATGLTSATVANPTVSLVNAGATATFAQYILLVTNTTTGCTDRDTVIVRVNPRERGLNVLDSICSGTVRTFGTPAQPDFSYSWTPAALFVTANTAEVQLVNPVHAGPAPLVLVAQRVVTNTLNGCSTTDTFTIRINPLPTVNAGIDRALCSGATATVGETRETGFTYDWTILGNTATAFVTLSDTAASNPLVTATNTGTSSQNVMLVVLKTNNQTGCTKTDTVNVLLFPLPEAIAAATDTVTICSAGNTQLGVAPVTNVTYAWLPTTGLNNAAIANPTVSRTITGNSTQVFQYILTATNTVTGCVKSDTVQVRVQPLPTVTLPANYTACSGASTTIGQAEVSNYRYRWTGTTFLNNDTLAQPTYTRSIANGAPQAVETLTLTVTDRSTGCVNTFTTELRTNSAPISLAGNDVTICSGDTATIGAAARAGEAYTWLTTDGVANTTAGLTTVTRLNTTSTPRVDTLIIRTTTVATGCTSQDTVLLTVNPRPSVGNIITGSNTLCPNVAGVVYTVPLEAGTTYNWTVNGGTIVAGQGTNTLVVDWGVANLNASVVVVPVNGLGCPGDTAKLDILVKIQLEPRTPVGDTLVCSAQNTVRYTTGSITGSQYTWYWQYNNGASLVTDSSAPGAAVVNITWPHVGPAKVWVKEVNTTSSNTCEGLSDTLNVNVYPSPDSTKTIQGPAAVCETTPSVTYTLAPTAGATYRWTVTGKIPNTGDTLLTGQGTNQITVGALVADTLVITVQETSNKGCEGKVIRDTLIINPLPVVVLGSTDSVCSGQPLQLGAAPVQNLRYRWTPATGLSNDTLANPVLTLTQTGSPAVYEYVLTVVNRLTGCENLDTIKVRVNPLPVANAGIDVALCSGDTVQVGVASVPNSIYTWSVVAPLATGLAGGLLIEDTCKCISNPRITLRNSTNQPIIQAFSMVVQDTLTGCFNYDTVQVRVNPLPIAIAYTADTVNICSGVATQLGVPATDSIRYQWTTIPISVPTGLNDDTLANPVLTLTQTGTALVRRYVVTATNRITGCSKTDTVVAIINPLPTMAFQELDSICANASKELRIVTSTNTRVVWSPATGLNRADSNVVTVSLPNTGTTPLFQIYTLTATDTVTGCVFVDTLTVKVNPLPRAFAGADNVVCTKSVITLGEAAQAGNTYLWAAGNGLVGANTTVANPTFQVLNTGTTAATYTYTLTVTSPSGCISRDTVAITVNPQPGTVLSNLTLCSGQPGTISTLVAQPGRTYQWIVGDSLSSTTDPAAGVRRTITGIVAQQFTYTLVTTITATGCRDTATMTLTVNPLPVAAAGRNYVLCSEDTITVGAGAAVPGTTYAWATRSALPGGVTVAIVNATAAQPRVTVVNTTGAAIYVPLSLNTSITATGCTNSDTTGILVHPLPVPVAGTQPVFTFCSGQSAQLGAAPVAGLSYSWSPATGLSNANIANPVVTLSQGGTTASQTRYVLRVTNTATGCDDTASVLVVVNPLPIVSRLPVANTCSDAPVVIGAPATPGFSYAWKPALNLDVTNVAQPTFRAINPGTTALNFDYTLVVTNTATGCVDSAVYSVQLNPLPTVQPGAPVATCSRVPVQIGAPSQVGLRYSWSPSVGLDDPAFANPTVTLQNTTGADITQVYTLTVTNTTTGCVNTGTVTVTVQPEPVTVRGAYDSLLCSTNLENRSYSVTTLPSSTLQWFVTGGTLLNVQPGVTTTITTAQVSWDSTATFYELKAVERSVNGCSAVDTVKFRLYYNNYRLVQLSTTRANDPADTAVYLTYKVTSVGNATPTAQVQVYRRIQGATTWELVGTSPATDTVYADRPAFASQLVYEYYMSITDQCGNLRVSLPAQTTLRLIGEGIAASGTSRLTWNPYEGWAEGVLRYDIYRRLNDDQYESTPYASVAGSANFWTANNGQDAFTQSYRIVAVRRGTNITAMSNEVVLEFQNVLQGYNVITPNGDGRNDELVFENLKLYGDGELTIFTRSGVQVYSSSSYQNNWRAEDVPAGTYYYMLKVGGARARTIKGFVEVMK